MKRFFQTLFKVAAYAAAALLILLAVGVGLFRLFLPRLPEYQEAIKVRASEAIGLEVEFSSMNARWGLSGPELEFYGAELVRRQNQSRLIAAARVSVVVSISSLIFDQKFVVDRVLIRNTSIEIKQLENDEWWVQDTALDELPQAQAGEQQLGEKEFVAENVEIHFLQLGDERPRTFDVRRALVSLDENRIAFDANVRLPDDLGRQATISATQLLGVPEERRSWDVTVEADDVLLAGWSALHPAIHDRVLSGRGDIDLSLVYSNQRISHATADADLENISLVEGQAFDLSGRFELDTSFDGWLVAAEEFRVSSDDHEWPETSLRAEASTAPDGRVVVLDVRASYLNLDDSSLILPLLPDEQREQLAQLSPTGEIRDLTATVSDLDRDKPQFDVRASFANAGFAALDKRPGVRGFSGDLRAGGSGGRLEVRSSNMLLDLPQFMDDSIDISRADGTIIWRRSNDRTTVLSDSIRIVNPVFDSRMSLHLTINDEGSSPKIDLDSSFKISDIGDARRYIPRKIMKPKLYNWFQLALVEGSIERGTLRLDGPLDSFPFDNDEGRLLIEATTRNLTLKYHKDWPAAEQADVDIVLDNMRLYSVRNRSVSAGNQAVDAAIEIPNLRKPDLTIDALITGSLETLRQFALESPIDVFTGGNLNRLTVEGDASFRLGLAVPLRNAAGTTVNGLLRSNNGTLAIDGLSAPITDLIGEIAITREQITGDSLGGRFLGEEVSFQLAPGDDPRFFTVATATGIATANGLIEELGVPLEGLIEGATEYEARIMFPRGKQEDAPPFTVQIESMLEGLALNFPDPAGKIADDSLGFRGDIRFMAGGELIESAGSADNGLAWTLSVTNSEGAWDFDRGVLMAGGGDIVPAETRGLHIRGTTSTVRLDEWLSLSRGGEKKIGAADRIRSIDLNVADAFAIGQHLRDHHVRIDRSARDWLVQIEGENVVGSVFVPYEFNADRVMVVEMERMHLPGDNVTPTGLSTLDPRTLPSIMLNAEDFALGDRYLGKVEASVIRTKDGLETEKLTATEQSFEIIGTGRWVADAQEEAGSRTYVTATLNSTDVESTLGRLDFVQGVSGETMGILFDLSWPGGPRADFLDVLDGQVQIRMQEGQLEEVEPGAGRMLGLVSFVALPRRLSLDFSDVFNKGFGYDSITGTFNIIGGRATTCDLSLEGPAANIGIVGQTDLAANEYEQAAVVTAKVGNTLPIVGAVVGGPPGAAAMLIFSQIFKKPLEEVGRVFYEIVGPWDDPDIESVGEDGFVRMTCA
jgi:uncharacterized protein (TIGR02099 family)